MKFVIHRKLGDSIFDADNVGDITICADCVTKIWLKDGDVHISTVSSPSQGEAPVHVRVRNLPEWVKDWDGSLGKWMNLNVEHPI